MSNDAAQPQLTNDGRQVKRTINFIGFQAVWLSAVLGAAGGVFWLGPVVLVPWLILHLMLSGQPKPDIRLAAVALCLGLLIDSLLISAGVYLPAGGFGDIPLAPPWLLALWVNFATVINHSLAWLKGRYWLGAALGAAGGPAAYYSGHRLGALTFAEPLTVNLAIMAIAWAAAIPLLFGVAAKSENRTQVL